ncbi:glycosyl transferase family 41-domain-containing protein, partial [Thamnocephalis sphaerospora]
YFIVDPIVCPPDTVACERWQGRPVDKATRMVTLHPGDCGMDLDPEDDTEPDWVYAERLIYMPHSYFVNDHRQGFREEDENQAHAPSLAPEQCWAHEEDRRWKMRREVFPGLRDDVVIFANFNQLYKIDPSIFRVWLRILANVPHAILWLLRFPAAGEQYILRTAEEQAGKEVASRIVFTDVAAKHIHIHRGRVADLFLDTPECNGHTTAADILWSGTPILTYPRHRHKMCSRVAASIAYATGYGDEMTVLSEQEYEARAVEYAQSVSWEYGHAPHPRQGLHRRGKGVLIELRKKLFLTRDVSPLFDTPRWTRNLEKGYWEAWRRWTSGEDFAADDDGQVRANIGCIYITDEDPPLAHISSTKRTMETATTLPQTAPPAASSQSSALIRPHPSSGALIRSAART